MNIISIERKTYGMNMFLNGKLQTPIVQHSVTSPSNLDNTQTSDHNSIVLTPDVPKSVDLGILKEKNITKFFERDATTKAEIL